jgi:hypothetical protein
MWYQPTGAQAFDEARLSIDSTDPVSPHREVVLRGYGGPANVFAAEPDVPVISVTVPSGGMESRTLTLWNGTSFPATWSVQALVPFGEHWLKALPSSGDCNNSPQAPTCLGSTSGRKSGLFFDATGLAPGTYQGIINVGITNAQAPAYYRSYTVELHVE